MKKKIIFLFIFLFFWTNSLVLAADTVIDCPDRYVTLVNPVRSRDLWLDKSLQPIKDQYTLIDQHQFSGTWLLQNDVFYDPELMEQIHQFNKKQEMGIFLEVSSKLADNAKVIYPYDVPWFSPKVVFLSGYSRSEREKLIDAVFKNFHNQFGYYPKVVGAWWIDSFSLQFLKEKYHISSALIVADQLTTDNYGVWGQWWGVPYYPTKTNILVPAQSVADKQNVVITQWAQRDLDLAYGQSPIYSNFSLQANDYIRQGKQTDYFSKVATEYLNCQMPIGQITVGLETGIESVDYIKEYKNQLDWIKTHNVQAVTMSQFADRYGQVFPKLPSAITLRSDKSFWTLDQKERKNDVLQDKVTYHSDISFSDYFVADKNNFLQRNLHQHDNHKNSRSFPWFFLLLIPFLWIILKRGRPLFGVVSLVFLIAAFGLVLRSYQQYGWDIWYGPQVEFLPLVQIIVVSVIIGVMFLLKTKTKLWVYIPLSFSVDFIVSFLRYSYISGNRLFGISTDALHFIGISSGQKISFLNTDLPAYQAAALLRIRFEQLNINIGWYFFISPLIHIAAGLLIGLVIRKLPSRWRKVVVFLLMICVILYCTQILKADPYSVTIIK